MQTTATLFWNGRSQAVRLPKEVRFKGDKVTIEKAGESVILRPVEDQWPAEFWKCFGAASGDFERQVLPEQVRDEIFP